jgi:hypothetical protein
MRVRVLAAMLGIGGFLFAGCSTGQSVPTQSANVAPSGIIRSQAGLQQYLSTAGSASPLNALSSGARQRFLSSLTFNAAGLTGFTYLDLQNELTASQVSDVLALFGAQKDVRLIPNVQVVTAADKRTISAFVDPVNGVDGDHPDFRCESRATCSPYTGDICTSNC